MRGRYGRKTWLGAEATSPTPTPSSAPTVILIVGGLAALVASVLRDEARASR